MSTDDLNRDMRLVEDNTGDCDECDGYGEVEVLDDKGNPLRWMKCPRCGGNGVDPRARTLGLADDWTPNENAALDRIEQGPPPPEPRR